MGLSWGVIASHFGITASFTVAAALLVAAATSVAALLAPDHQGAQRGRTHRAQTGVERKCARRARRLYATTSSPQVGHQGSRQFPALLEDAAPS